MSHGMQFYIDGEWVAPGGTGIMGVVDPPTAEVFAQLPLGDASDADRAVAAARRAFATLSSSEVEERRQLLLRIVAVNKKRGKELAAAISRAMGAPRRFAHVNQVGAGLAQLATMAETLKNFEFHRAKGRNMVVREPIGVAALITPWNWPLNQIACKVAPALAAGCTMVLKPSESAPLSAVVFAEILEEAGVPKGVFNLVHGTGPVVGQALAAHPQVDMVSVTGSTRGGILVAKAAADTVKRVHQELGGKSANVLLDDVDLRSAVTAGVKACFGNSGQSCNAPSRMFVPRALHDAALLHAREAAEAMRVGPADAEDVTLGPIANAAQFERVQQLIAAGIEEGATLVTGGLGRPDGLDRGYFVKPTVFGNVSHGMSIAREEIFGPVLSILPYGTLDQAIEQANDTPFGLAAYVQASDIAKARHVASRMRAGSVYINNPPWNAELPFGGYKQSGDGREQAEFGLEDFLEIKGIAGYEAA